MSFTVGQSHNKWLVVVVFLILCKKLISTLVDVSFSTFSKKTKKVFPSSRLSQKQHKISPYLFLTDFCNQLII